MQSALQFRKFTGSFFRERHRANKFFHNAENGCGKPFKILRRIIRCEHQHQITRVGVLALDLCSTQLFGKLCSGKPQNRSVQRDFERFTFQCQRPRTVFCGSSFVQLPAQAGQMTAALQKPQRITL